MSFIRGVVVTASLCAAGLLAGPGSALAAGGHGALAFSTGPQSAVIDQPITGATINPSGPPITVRLLDDSGNLKTRSQAPVTISIGRNPAGGVLRGATTVDAVDGIATFRNLTINRPAGGYTLLAASPGLTSVPSDRFDEYSAAAFCLQGQSCSTSVTTPVSQLQVTANPTHNTKPDSGILTESVDVGTPLNCAGYEAADPNWFQFLSSSNNRTKVVTYTLDNTSPEGTQVCFGAPYEFTTSSGAPAPAVTLSNGTTEFDGLLPACSAVRGPCVASITSSEAGEGVNTVITVHIPDGLVGDPRMHA